MGRQKKQVRTYKRKILTGIVVLVLSPFWFFVVLVFYDAGFNLFDDGWFGGFIFAVFVPFVAALIGLSMVINGIYDSQANKK